MTFKHCREGAFAQRNSLYLFFFHYIINFRNVLTPPPVEPLYKRHYTTKYRMLRKRTRGTLLIKDISHKRQEWLHRACLLYSGSTVLCDCGGLPYTKILLLQHNSSIFDCGLTKSQKMSPPPSAVPVSQNSAKGNSFMDKP